MKFRKILTGVLAASLAVTSLSLGVFAEDTEKSVTDNTGKGTVSSDQYGPFCTYHISDIKGDATFNLSDIGGVRATLSVSDEYANGSLCVDSGHSDVSGQWVGNWQAYSFFFNESSATQYNGHYVPMDNPVVTFTGSLGLSDDDTKADIVVKCDWSSFSIEKVELLDASGNVLASVEAAAEEGGEVTSSSSSTGSDDPQDVTTTELYTGTTPSGKWTYNITLPLSKLTNIKAGDQLIITVGELDTVGAAETDSNGYEYGNKVSIQDSSWNALPGAEAAGWESWGGKSVTVGDVVYTVQESDVAALKNGAYVKGACVTITKVVLKATVVSEPVEEETTTTEEKFSSLFPGSSGSSGSHVTVNYGSTTDSSSDVTPTEVVTAANGESVEAPADVIPTGAILEVKEQTKEDAVKAVEAITATDVNKEVVETVKKAVEDEKAVVVEIDLVKDGKKVQPDGTIKVTINVPAALKDAAKLFVYRVEADGTFTDVKAAVENGKIVFSTSHFSTYIITSEALSGDAVVTEAPAAAPTTPEKTDDKNQATGVIIAIIPAILAASGVIVSKKRK